MSLWQNYWAKVGTSAGQLGNTLGLPEFGVSERLGSTWQPAKFGEEPGTSNNQRIYGPPHSGPQQTTQTQPTGGAASDWSTYHTGEGTMPAGYGGEGGGDPSVTGLQTQQRGEIEGGYSNYFAYLDQMMGELPNQRSAQEKIVTNQYGQAFSDLSGQKAVGLADLGLERSKTESSQARNLGELADAIKGQFLAGQMRLGAVGAGDSSAVNQYSYALTKLGSKARGDLMNKTADIMSEIGNREFKLKTTYDTEISRLNSEKMNKISEISSWFSEATNQIRQMHAQGELSKGQDLASLTQNALNFAIQQANQAQTGYINAQNMLKQWAANNSSNLAQLKTNMQGISQYSPNLPQFTGVSGQPTWDVGGNLNAPIGFGVSDEDKSLT